MSEIVNRSFSLAFAVFLPFSLLMGAYQQDPIRKAIQNKGDLHALIIGNNAYQEGPLRNPINDAKAIDKAITVFGFNVNLVLDAKLKKLEEAIDRFIASLEPGGVGLFFFAGHGIQLEGENYLVPVDFTLRDAADAKYSSYMVSRLIDRMEGARTRLNIIILDACRSNPFLPVRSPRGLAIMSTPGRGTFIALATGPGKLASDNPEGSNGLFTNCLLEALKKPGLTLDEIFAEVKERVYDASNGKQTPWIASNVIGKPTLDPYKLAQSNAASGNAKKMSPTLPADKSSNQGGPAAPPATANSEFSPTESDHTELEIIGHDGKRTLLSDPSISYPGTFGPSKSTEGIVVRRGVEQSTLLWSRLRTLRFRSRQEKNEKGTTVWRHAIEAALTNGKILEVEMVDDWNMAYMGGGGTGLLFGQSDLGESRIPFSSVSVLRVLKFARPEKK